MSPPRLLAPHCSTRAVNSEEGKKTVEMDEQGFYSRDFHPFTLLVTCGVCCKCAQALHFFTCKSLSVLQNRVSRQRSCTNVNSTMFIWTIFSFCRILCIMWMSNVEYYFRAFLLYCTVEGAWDSRISLPATAFVIVVFMTINQLNLESWTTLSPSLVNKHQLWPSGRLMTWREPSAHQILVFYIILLFLYWLCEESLCEACKRQKDASPASVSDDVMHLPLSKCACVCVCVCVYRDNGIIEMQGMAGAQKPGHAERS